MSAAGVGAGYGFRPGVRYIGGLWFGNLVVGLVVISGLWAMLLTIPGLRLVFGIASLCYLGYLALRIAAAGSEIRFIGANRAPGFRAGTLLQFINPKAYAVNTFLFSNFAFMPQSWLGEVPLAALKHCQQIIRRCKFLRIGINNLQVRQECVSSRPERA